MDGIELFCRSFIGASYLISAETMRGRFSKDIEHIIEYYSKGILEGTSLASKEFWGDSSHLLIENTSIIIGLFETEKYIWDQYKKEEQKCIIDYIRTFLGKSYYQNNWLWFMIFHFLFLERFGNEDYYAEIIELLKKIEQWHLGNGWYSDGNHSDSINIDYYAAWAMQYYANAFIRHASGKYSKQKKKLIEHSSEFIKTYQYFFAPKTINVPYGRSQLYRFATVGPIGLILSNQNSSKLDFGRLKTGVFDNIKVFFQKGVLDSDGFLTMGFLRACPYILEHYSGSGSPYWAMKFFSLLCIPDNSPFWTTLPKKESFEHQITIKPIKQVIVNNRSSEIKLFNCGSINNNYPSKYNKFVYSNLFCGSYLKKGLFPDNTLLIKVSNKWHSIGKILFSSVESGICRMRWTFEKLESVFVDTLIVAFSDGYFFSHSISSPFDSFFKIGGFLIEDSVDCEYDNNQSSVMLRNSANECLSFISVGNSDVGCVSVESTKHTINGKRCSCPIYSGWISANANDSMLAGWVGTSIGLGVVEIPKIEIVGSQFILKKGQDEYIYKMNNDQNNCVYGSEIK